MELTTPRLLLSEISAGDLEKVHALHSLPETDEFNTLGIPETLETTKKVLEDWLQKQDQKLSHIFSVNTKDDNLFIGLMALNIGKEKYRTAEVWFKTHKDFWNKGYTTEALNELLGFAFNDLNLHRVEAGCAVENIASARVLEKTGFTKEGHKRKKLPIRGEWKDNFFYAILDEDFDRRAVPIPTL